MIITFTHLDTSIISRLSCNRPASCRHRNLSERNRCRDQL